MYNFFVFFRINNFAEILSQITFLLTLPIPYAMCIFFPFVGIINFVEFFPENLFLIMFIHSVYYAG